MAYRDLDEQFFNNWKQRHQEAALSLTDRDERLDAIYEEIERDMVLLGSTAIEDKLQDGVPQAISNLVLAGIKIWVLTGDKQGECYYLMLFIHLFEYVVILFPFIL